MNERKVPPKRATYDDDEDAQVFLDVVEKWRPQIRMTDRTLKHWDASTLGGGGVYMSSNNGTVADLVNVPQGVGGVARDYERIGNEIFVVSIEIRMKISPHDVLAYNGGSPNQMAGCGYLAALVWLDDAEFGTGGGGSPTHFFDPTNVPYSIAPKQINHEEKFQVLRRESGVIVGSRFNVNTEYQTYNPAVTGFAPYGTCVSSNHHEMTKYVHWYVPINRVVKFSGQPGNTNTVGDLRLILCGDNVASVGAHEAPYCQWHSRLRFIDHY